MTWVSAGIAVGGAALGAMSSDGGSKTNGGAGTTTGTKEPWLQAQPWIMNNMTSGQALQNQYTQNPFNAQQLGAHQALSGQTGYMNSLVPSLLGQISGQQVGFDRSNPNARPTAYNFNGTGGNAGSGSGGLLGMLSGAQGGTSAANPPPPAAAPAQTNDFVQQGYNTNFEGANNMDPNAYTAWGAGGPPVGVPGGGNYTGKLGTFKYGDAMPQAGTQQYRDMSAYFANGGVDPANLYGRGTPMAQGGGNVGAPGAGGVGAAGGAGAGTAAGGAGW